MRFVLSTLHFANLRNYESAICALAERGHHVHLLADETEVLGGQALVERLSGAYPTVTSGMAPSSADEPWFPFAQKVRYALDYVRFLAPRYHDVPKLRLRNVERAPRVVLWLTSGIGGALVGHRPMSRLLQWLERRMPRNAAMERCLADLKPDVLLLTTLTFSRSSQIEQLKAAKALGLRTAACILSWDHLSSKALLHIAPDRTVVWNDVQKREAVDMHGLPPEQVVVTGAQCYDHWFDKRPSRTREEFCAAMGLDPSRRIVLYVCSTMSPALDPVEPVFVTKWLGELRATGSAELREASVIVRPHPERLRDWKGISLEGFDHVVRHGRSPIDPDAKADYFDSLYYSDAVVGLCTSAFIEAAIVGRPVLSLLLPEYRMHQDGMAHFRYLLNVGGGLLHTAPDLATHVEQLAEAVSRHGARDERNRQFIEAFVRPFGLDKPSTPAFVAAIEGIALDSAPAPDPRFTTQSMAARSVARLAVATQSGVGRWLMMDAVDHERERSERASELTKHEIVSTRSANRQAKADRVEHSLREKARQRRAKSWARWRRGINPHKQVARFKRSLKQLLGAGSS